ncbi:hypothetical protein BJ912DRAFT_1138644 [Pholiota molesta]|nr:hypothetical protein BJ912DRAFT_1138644 [Pholiota molesta]
MLNMVDLFNHHPILLRCLPLSTAFPLHRLPSSPTRTAVCPSPPTRDVGRLSSLIPRMREHPTHCSMPAPPRAPPLQRGMWAGVGHHYCKQPRTRRSPPPYHTVRPSPQSRDVGRLFSWRMKKRVRVSMRLASRRGAGGGERQRLRTRGSGCARARGAGGSRRAGRVGSGRESRGLEIAGSRTREALTASLPSRPPFADERAGGHHHRTTVRNATLQPPGAPPASKDDTTDGQRGRWKARGHDERPGRANDS